MRNNADDRKKKKDARGKVLLNFTVENRFEDRRQTGSMSNGVIGGWEKSVFFATVRLGQIFIRKEKY